MTKYYQITVKSLLFENVTSTQPASFSTILFLHKTNNLGFLTFYAIYLCLEQIKVSKILRIFLRIRNILPKDLAKSLFLLWVFKNHHYMRKQNSESTTEITSMKRI